MLRARFATEPSRANEFSSRDISHRTTIKGNNMATNAPSASSSHLEFIGMIVEIAGVASAVAGVVLSLHHWPAAVALIGGGVAYVIGKKLRAS